MDDEEIESLLVYALNERQTSEDAWHDLCTGGKEREEVVALRTGIETEQALTDKLELFAPMTKDVRDATLATLLDRYYAHDPAVPAASDDVVADPPAQPTVAVASRTEPALGERDGRWWATAAIAGVMALAAAMLLAWLLPRASPSSDPLPMAVMPHMTVTLRGDDPHGMRSSAGPADPEARCDAWYRPGQTLSVVLKPTPSLQDDLAILVSARREGGSPSPEWPTVSSPLQGPEGTLTLEQPLAELGLVEEGTWTLTFYVIRAEQPLEETALLGLEPGAHRGVSVVERTICIGGLQP
jgi:hypothetical protein